MALGPIVAAALTDHSARAFGLTIAGNDVAKQPGTLGFGVDPASVEVFESGPGGASSISFVVDDPLLSITVTDGDPILFWNITRDVPEFGGWVQSWSPTPAFGTGRQIAVRGIGYDAVLDWAVVPPVVVPDATPFPDVVLKVAAAAYGAGPLRAFAPASGTLTGDQARPVGRLAAAAVTADPLFGSAAQTLKGGTLRETLRQIGAMSWNIPAGGISLAPIPGLLAWVDFYYGLRVTTEYQLTAPFGTISGSPSDYGTLTVTDTLAGVTPAKRPQLTTDAAGVPRSVVVTGTGVTATVSDGSGKLGPIAQLTDTSLTSVAACVNAGIAYLSGFAVALRGEFDIEDFTPGATLHVGSPALITDAQLGIAGINYRMAGINKHYRNTKQDWHVAFGGRAPTVTAALRRLTRDTLS